jgi:signal transduction histidine kinase/ActR/RegA family two-component response regulator
VGGRMSSMWRQAWHFDEPRVLAAQMGLIDRNYVPAFLSSVLVAVIAAWGLQSVTQSAGIWGWAVAHALLGLLFVILRRWLPSPHEPASAPRYARWVRGMAMLIGASWGALAWFIDAAQPLTLTVILGVEGGMTAGALAVFSPSWPIALAFWLCAITPVAAALFASGDLVHGLFGGAVSVYLVSMATFGYHAGQTTLRAIRLGFENEGLVKRLRDQTQRALEARQLAEGALAEAEDANRAKTVFLAAVSHDLRQPLHAMGLVLGALSGAGLNPRQQAMLGQAQASALATGDMLATLLDFSKVDAGVVKPQLQAFNLQLLFAKLARELAPVAEAKGLVFRVRDTSLVMHSDPALVELILRNLLLNAIRYTERGGVLLACRRRGCRASVEVWDTGIGIPQSQHEAVFREFHQLGNPERDRGKGLGLGLAIVQGLARALSVDVGLDSRVGHGSVFRLALPLSAQPVQDALHPAPDEPDLHGLKVLLVDDDEHVCAAMRDLLATWGCWCEAVPSGDEAVRVLEQFEPDLMLTDYRLKGHRTGMQALQQVRAHLGRVLPAAIVTGDTAPERLREAAASGLLLLHKPVPAQRLQSVLLHLTRDAQHKAPPGTLS